MKLFRSEQLTDQPTSFRSKSTKFTERMHLVNIDPSKPVQPERTHRPRANSIREVLLTHNEQALIQEPQPIVRSPFVDIKTDENENIAIPTFGNWKKNQNLMYAIDTELYEYLRYRKPSKKNFRLADSHNSERSSRSKHPKFPRNNRILSKFCSKEFPMSCDPKTLPVISKTQRLMAYKLPDNSPPAEMQTLQPSVSYKLQSTETQSTKQSQQAKQNRLEIAALKLEFARIYKLQKARYQQILNQKGLNINVPEEEYTNFMKKLRTNCLDQ